MEIEMSKKYRIAISMIQQTDGEPDDNTLVEDFSDDAVVHLIKTKVFTKHFTNAVNEATQELCDMALEANGAAAGNNRK